ncbi:MAG TPA: Rho termination factor N-terminal domain-containing protein, partial [Acidimicrobiales bacterium]|nr:Rho termination factor N-terminal domain-containing protein [Acidimicrobiales bacterium]
MSGEQLERSILERKERDELHAIAEAMALKPAARSKKADIIDQILQATGVETLGNGAIGNGSVANGTSSNGHGAPEAEASAPAARRSTSRAKVATITEQPTVVDGVDGGSAEAPD